MTKNIGFNHAAFWEWAEKQSVPVYVSEYDYHGKNPDAWECVWEKSVLSRRSINADGKRNIRTERLYWNRVMAGNKRLEAA